MKVITATEKYRVVPFGNRERPDRKAVTWCEGGWTVFRLETDDRIVYAVIHPFSGQTARTRCIEPWADGAVFYHSLRSWAMGWVSKVAGGSAGDPADPAYPADWPGELDALGEYLTLGKYPDGTPRTRSTMTLMAGDIGGVKVCLNDRDNAQSMWATGDTVNEAFEALEGMLRSQNPPWRRDNRPQTPKGKR